MGIVASLKEFLVARTAESRARLDLLSEAAKSEGLKRVLIQHQITNAQIQKIATELECERFFTDTMESKAHAASFLWSMGTDQRELARVIANNVKEMVMSRARPDPEAIPVKKPDAPPNVVDIATKAKTPAEPNLPSAS